jgi:hypothetical protein
MVVKAGHSSRTALLTTFGSNLNSGSTQTVYSGAVTIPAMASGATYTLTFSQPFDYNGVDNLILDFDGSVACDPLFVERSSAIADRTLFALSSGAATGALRAISPNVAFNFAGGDDGINFGAASGTSYPFDNLGEHVQLLYLKDDINGSGPITGIGIPVTSVTTQQSYTVTLKLGHTTLSALTATYASNFNSGSPVTLAAAGSFKVPAGVPIGSYIWIPLTGAFTYNGTDNLIVDLDVTAGAGQTMWAATPVAAGRRVYGPFGATTGTVDSPAYHVKFRFHGGKVDVTTIAATAGDNFPFNSTSGMRQLLYLATELGTSGSINEIECRNYGSAGSSSGGRNTYKIVMSHLSAATLSTNRAANVPSPVTVVDGAVMMHAELIAGDYFSIPLTKAFNYNGTDNLVIDISGTGMASGFACALSLDALYTGRRSLGAPTDATVGLETGLPTMRFSISK